MIKKTLLAIVVLAFLASVVPTLAITGDTATYPPFAVYQFNLNQTDYDRGLKVDGKTEVRWPFDYKWLEICKIPVKMKIGMFIRVDECADRKIVLVQKDCADPAIGKAENEWPCYWGCVTLKIRANFNAQIRGELVDRSSVINGDRYSVSVDPSTITGDGNDKDVTFCVKTWRTKIEKAAAGDEVDVANLSIQARPAV